MYGAVPYHLTVLLFRSAAKDATYKVSEIQHIIIHNGFPLAQYFRFVQYESGDSGHDEDPNNENTINDPQALPFNSVRKGNELQ